MLNWKPPEHWPRITTIDAHTAGEPLRIITGGFPDLPGSTILEKRHYARQHYDHLRRTLMWEPRGHADMYGCILTPPVTPDGDVGVPRSVKLAESDAARVEAALRQNVRDRQTGTGRGRWSGLTIRRARSWR